MLTNEYIYSFKERVKSASLSYRDQPMTPQETAVFWVEYVIRHRGAIHMQSAAKDLSFVEYNMLDVFALMIFISLLLMMILIMALRFVYKSIILRTNFNPTKKDL